MASEVHVGDVGTIYKQTMTDGGVVSDVSAATDQLFHVLKPDGSTTTWKAEFTTDGSDGAIEYETVDGDLSVFGTYYIQARIVFGDGSITRAARQRLIVHPKVL